MKIQIFILMLLVALAPQVLSAQSPIKQLTQPAEEKTTGEADGGGKKILEIWQNLKNMEDKRAVQIKSKTWTLAQNKEYFEARNKIVDEVRIFCRPVSGSTDAPGKYDVYLIKCAEISMEKGHFDDAVYYVKSAVNGSLKADALTQQARGFYNQKQYLQAVAAAVEAIGLNPQNAVAYNVRGVSIMDGKGDIEKAIADFNEAIRLAPNARHYVNRGRASIVKKDYAKSLEDFNKALELEPYSAFYFYLRGLSYFNLNNFDKTLSEMTEALRLSPTYNAAFELRRQALIKLGRTAEANADKDFSEKANVCYEKKDFSCAVENYTKAIGLNPTFSGYYNNRGNAFYLSEKTTESIADYSKAIELSPDDADAYLNRGNAYQKIKEYIKALSDFAQSNKLKPNEKALLYRGNLNLIIADNAIFKIQFQSSVEAALKDFTEAIKINPQYAEAYTRRAAAYRLAEKTAEAQADEKKAAELKSSTLGGEAKRVSEANPAAKPATPSAPTSTLKVPDSQSSSRRDSELESAETPRDIALLYNKYAREFQSLDTDFTRKVKVYSGLRQTTPANKESLCQLLAEIKPAYSNLMQALNKMLGVIESGKLDRIPDPKGNEEIKLKVAGRRKNLLLLENAIKTDSNSYGCQLN